MLALCTGSVSPIHADELRGQYRNFGFEGKVAGGAQFDSNVDRLGFDSQPDMASTVNPDLSLSYTRPRMQLRSDASYHWQHYYGLPTDANAYDRHALELRESSQFTFATGLRMIGEYEYTRSDDAVYYEIEGGSAVLVGRYRHLGRFLAGQTFGGTQSDTEAEYVFYKEGYRSSRLQQLDNYTHSGQIRSKYQLRPKTALFGQMGVVFHVPVDKLAYPYSDKRINVAFRPGLRTQWTRKIGFSVSAGVSVWIFDTTTRTTPIVVFDVDYRPTPLMRAIFSYEFATKDSVTSTYFDLNRFVLTFERKLSRSWDSSMSVDYSLVKFGPPFPRTDHLIKPRAGLTYQPVQLAALTAGLQYAFERRFSPEVYNDLLRGRALSMEGRNHSVGLDVTWSF